MKEAIKILKAEIAQRNLALSIKSLRENEIKTELNSFNKTLAFIMEIAEKEISFGMQGNDPKYLLDKFKKEILSKEIRYMKQSEIFLESKELKNEIKSSFSVRYLLRQWYKFFDYEGKGNNHLYGKFRVRYADGRRSKPMCYRVAKDYAQMFNGTVIDNF